MADPVYPKQSLDSAAAHQSQAMEPKNTAGVDSADQEARARVRIGDPATKKIFSAGVWHSANSGLTDTRVTGHDTDP